MDVERRRLKAKSRERKNQRFRFLDHAFDSVMIRGIDGNIHFWNRAAEKRYGWTQRDAVGNISHNLLHTIFPCPLSEINRQLLEQGFWEGELIHSLSDGERVKVWSRWELKSDDAEKNPDVIEINKVAQVIRPETAHLKPRLSLSQRLVWFMWENKVWWLVPLVTFLLAGWGLIQFTHHHHIGPPPG